MKEKEKHIIIGQLIKEEVERQGLSAIEFGKKISCERANVYKIFNRNTIDTALLGIISNALNHDFFADIVANPLLSGVDDKEARREVYNKMAVAQFTEVVPRVLERLGIEPCIFFGRPLDIDHDIPIPDYYINPNINLTLDDLLINKLNVNLGNTIEIKRFEDQKSGLIVDMWRFQWSEPMLNIILDYKTEEEWEHVFRYIFGTFFPYMKLNQYDNS